MKTALSLFALITLVFGVGCQTISQTKSVNKGPVSQPIANKKGKSNPLAKLTGKKTSQGPPGFDRSYLERCHLHGEWADSNARIRRSPLFLRPKQISGCR